MVSASLPMARVSRWWLSAAVAGIALGVLTNLAQGWLPGSFNQIANSGALWSVPAFAARRGGRREDGRTYVGARRPVHHDRSGRRHYGYAELGRSGMGSLAWPLVWLVMAVLSGPLFGVAGAWWRRGHTTRRRVAGLAALAGVFGTEAILATWALHYEGQAWGCAALLALVPLAMARGHKERALTLLTAWSSRRSPTLWSNFRSSTSRCIPRKWKTGCGAAGGPRAHPPWSPRGLPVRRVGQLLGEGDIPDVVRGVLHSPVPANRGGQVGGPGLVGVEAVTA